MLEFVYKTTISNFFSNFVLPFSLNLSSESGFSIMHSCRLFSRIYSSWLISRLRFHDYEWFLDYVILDYEFFSMMHSPNPYLFDSRMHNLDILIDYAFFSIVFETWIFPRSPVSRLFILHFLDCFRLCILLYCFLDYAFYSILLDDAFFSIFSIMFTRICILFDYFTFFSIVRESLLTFWLLWIPLARIYFPFLTTLTPSC